MPAPLQPAFQAPLTAARVDGEVVITHPDTSVALAVTPEAAEASARNILEAASDDAEVLPPDF